MYACVYVCMSFQKTERTICRPSWPGEYRIGIYIYIYIYILMPRMLITFREPYVRESGYEYGYVCEKAEKGLSGPSRPKNIYV